MQETTMTIRHENDELVFRFTRRRYGRQTYTWAEVRFGDDWADLGDPWPSVTPPRKQLISEALRVIGDIKDGRRTSTGQMIH